MGFLGGLVDIGKRVTDGLGGLAKKKKQLDEFISQPAQMLHDTVDSVVSPLQEGVDFVRGGVDQTMHAMGSSGKNLQQGLLQGISGPEMTSGPPTGLLPISGAAVQESPLANMSSIYAGVNPVAGGEIDPGMPEQTLSEMYKRRSNQFAAERERMRRILSEY